VQDSKLSSAEFKVPELLHMPPPLDTHEEFSTKYLQNSSKFRNLFSSTFSLNFILFCSHFVPPSASPMCCRQLFLRTMVCVRWLQKSLLFASLLPAQSRARTSQNIDFRPTIPILFYTIKSENIKSVWYIPHLVRVRVLQSFLFSLDLICRSGPGFFLSPRPLLADFGRSRGSPNPT